MAFTRKDLRFARHIPGNIARFVAVMVRERGNPMTHEDTAARFEAVALPHMDTAYNLARWLTGDAHDAADVAQDAMLRAFRFFDAFHGGDARAWVLRIVRNTYYSSLRRTRARGSPVEFDDELHSLEDDAAISNARAGDPQDIVSRAQSIRRVDAELSRLPVEYREVLVLREVEDLSYREIAELLEVPIGTVMSRLSRARRWLADRLRDEDARRAA
jgi:RNA polymerase sigma-70 factor, ECF subfamily